MHQGHRQSHWQKSHLRRILPRKYVGGTRTMIPGSPAITVSSTVISLALFVTAIILGGSNTVHLVAPSSPSAYNTFRRRRDCKTNRNSHHHYKRPTPHLHTRQLYYWHITVDSVPIHVSGSHVIYGNSTIPISAIATADPIVLVTHPLASAMFINSQTLVQGSSAVKLEADTGMTRIVGSGLPRRA